MRQKLLSTLPVKRLLFNVRNHVTVRKTNGTSLSESEMAHFRSHSSHWWSGPEFAPLRTLNSLRVPLISSTYAGEGQSQQQKPLTGVRLLDVGCGGGILSEPLARLGAIMTSIDPVAENIQAAKAHAAATLGPRVVIPRYLDCSIEAFAADPLNAEAFDGVIASEVLDHVDDVSLFLRSCLAVLRPSGHLFISTINQTFLAYLTIIFAGELLGFIPKGTHEYRKLVPPESLRFLLEQDLGCSVGFVKGTLFNPLIGQWSWTELQALSYAMVAVKL